MFPFVKDVYLPGNNRNICLTGAAKSPFGGEARKNGQNSPNDLSTHQLRKAFAVLFLSGKPARVGLGWDGALDSGCKFHAHPFASTLTGEPLLTWGSVLNPNLQHLNLSVRRAGCLLAVSPFHLYYLGLLLAYVLIVWKEKRLLMSLLVSHDFMQMLTA